jgi:hypothetical protein
MRAPRVYRVRDPTPVPTLALALHPPSKEASVRAKPSPRGAPRVSPTAMQIYACARWRAKTSMTGQATVRVLQGVLYIPCANTLTPPSDLVITAVETTR